jgi:hypothetical protein
MDFKKYKLINLQQMHKTIKESIGFSQHFSIENINKNLIMIYKKAKQDVI